MFAIAAQRTLMTSACRLEFFMNFDVRQMAKPACMQR